MLENIKNKTIKLMNKTTNIVTEKSLNTYKSIKSYYERERNILPQVIIDKIDNDIRNKSVTTALKGEIISGRISIYETKISGFPYLPKDMEMPKDKNGNEMRLFVQINCEDLKRIPYFPHHGMIQIYLSRNKLYGLNVDNHYDQNWFKVIYHEKINKEVKIKDVMKKTLLNELEDFPLRHECPIYFTPFTDYINSKDIRYISEFQKQVQNLKLNYKIFSSDEIYKMVGKKDKFNIQIGGYPNFMKKDPRKCNDNCNILLFQLITDGKNVKLGEKGIINFFIDYNDLLNLNFSKVFYTWDCI